MKKSKLIGIMSISILSRFIVSTTMLIIKCLMRGIMINIWLKFQKEHCPSFIINSYDDRTDAFMTGSNEPIFIYRIEPQSICCKCVYFL